MRVVPTFAEVRAEARGRVGLVPTMGFLHEGHLSLASAARAGSDTVVMSLFVNPLQFSEEEDLDSYPADLERDAALAEAAGVDILFAPGIEEMYPRDPATAVRVRGLENAMEGASRPGHFAGVAVVVAKLFAGTQPDRAYFGRKDAQQLAVVRRLAADLSFPIEVVGCPIVREMSGLALSSRNSYLSADERKAAGVLFRGLMAAADSAEAGERSSQALTEIVRAEVASEAAVELEYAVVASADDVVALARLDRPAFLALAARVGPARLIDNIHFAGIDDRFVADRGSLLERPSVLYEHVLADRRRQA